MSPAAWVTSEKTEELPSEGHAAVRTPAMTMPAPAICIRHTELRIHDLPHLTEINEHVDAGRTPIRLHQVSKTDQNFQSRQKRVPLLKHTCLGSSRLLRMRYASNTCHTSSVCCNNGSTTPARKAALSPNQLHDLSHRLQTYLPRFHAK